MKQIIMQESQVFHVASKIIKGYVGGNWSFDKKNLVFVLSQRNGKSLDVESTGMMSTVNTTYKAASLAVNLIALNNLCWFFYEKTRESEAEYYSDRFHDLRDKVLSDENIFSLTQDEISAILTIID